MNSVGRDNRRSTVSRRSVLKRVAAVAGALPAIGATGPRVSGADSSAVRGPMLGLIYFDTEDFFSPPDSPTHTLPGQLADIMHKRGLPGCFHIHGERARYWERHGMTGVIESIKRHDVSLHYDRGSIHPTTAEEVSQLDWFRGVERTMFREQPGFQALERIFGKCSALTQHGGTFAAQIVYAAGRLGKPFFYSPFRLPRRNVVWFCNNLLVGGYQARSLYFDAFYRDTPQFDARLARVDGYLDERFQQGYDFTAMFGCHPVITITEQFPDAINFDRGATPPPEDWVAPRLIPGVSIPLVLENFERLIVKLVEHPRVKWTTVAGMHRLYGQRPLRVPDAEVLRGAREVVQQGGPAWITTLSAAELLFLLARRAVAPAERYDVPEVMGPVDEAGETGPGTGPLDPKALAGQVLEAVMGSGYLPASLQAGTQRVSLELATLLLACHANGQSLPGADRRRLSIDEMPGVAEAIENVKKYKDWRIHGPQYHQAGILKHFRLQCWTLKPAFTEGEYPGDIKIGRDPNPMFERKI